jgi:hypothetical protein
MKSFVFEIKEELSLSGFPSIDADGKVVGPREARLENVFCHDDVSQAVSQC